MHRMLTAWVTLAALAASGLGAAAGDAERSAVVTGNDAFAIDLYAKLRDAEGNLFLSPFSISTAFAMTRAGARGRTAEQMDQALGFTVGPERLHPAFAGLLRQLNAPSKKGAYELSVANALWGQKGYGFLREFLDLTQAHYGAGLREVDFRSATEAARQTINRWVEDQTRDKIRELLKPGVLNNYTRLVLTNAIYFKGNWATQFDKRRTRDAPFTLGDGRKVQAPMMHRTDDYGYLDGDGFQALSLPYVGNDLSMAVFLPAKADGLPAFEKALTAEKLAGWITKLRRREVVVSLPKFQMTSEFSLAGVLGSMGMSDAFSAKDADLSGMNGKRDLFIQAVVHKAFVEVNEEGTEAAAATAIAIGLTAVAPQRKPVFRADHPFLFLIRDNRSGSILFLGRIANPKE